MLGRARRARVIDFDVIRDDSVSVMQRETFAGVEAFEEQMIRKARMYERDRQEGQPYRIELWCEASGMMPQLSRVARPYSIPVYSASGFTSLSAVRHIADRAVDDDLRPTLLLHVGDFDPSGAAIFDHIAEDAAAFVEVDRIIASQRIEAVRVALTASHVAEYGLPTAPPKKKDTRSAKWKGETCQLEALTPDVLAELVEQAIAEHLDDLQYLEVVEAEETERRELVGRLLTQGDDDA